MTVAVPFSTTEAWSYTDLTNVEAASTANIERLWGQMRAVGGLLVVPGEVYSHLWPDDRERLLCTPPIPVPLASLRKGMPWRPPELWRQLLVLRHQVLWLHHSVICIAPRLYLSFDDFRWHDGQPTPRIVRWNLRTLARPNDRPC